MPDLITDQFDTVGAAAKGCDVILGANAHQYAARSIAEREGLPYVTALYAPVALPSPEHAPPPGPGQAWQPGTPAGNEQRWSDATAAWNASALQRVNDNRARLGLTPIDDVLRHNLTDRPWLAADADPRPGAGRPPGMDVVQTGAWLLPDPTPLPPPLEAFLDAGDPPVYVGFGSMPMPPDASRALIDAARAAGRRIVLSQGWADLGSGRRPRRTASPSATSTSRRCSRGWRPSCTTAARAPPSPPPAPACRRSWCRCSATSSTGPPGCARSASAPRCPPAR